MMNYHRTKQILRKYQILKIKAIQIQMNIFLIKKESKRKRTNQQQIIDQIKKENQIKSKKLNKKY